MSSIDSRVVQMLFDNATFERGVATTLASLDKLNKGLQLQGATKGLTDVGDAANRVSLNGLTSGIDAAASHFKAMSVIGVTALATITNKVVDAGLAVAKAFVIDPVKDGFKNYETQINAVQTILANTGLTGAAGLSKVNAVLAQLNTYANQTVYNFSDMAKNIGTFTAAGVGLQDSVNSIKGIANLAALSGSSADQASTAMYQLSQSIASGRVQLQDWNSVVNAGLGGKVFQTALENTARATGVNIDAIIKKAGSFRSSLQEGWLTSGILTKTLAQFTGDLSAAQLKSMGFTAQQAQQILQLGQTAVNAATKIKTATQLVQALKEEVATAYGAIFKTIFGDIGQATDLFSAIHSAAENALTGPIYALNSLLQGWSALGGRTVLITALTHVVNELGEAVGIVSAAFREVFPPTTANQLFSLTKSFLALVDSFKIGAKTQEELKSTFAGLFSVISIVLFVIRQLIGQFAALFGFATQGAGGILVYTARIGDFLVKLKTLIETSSSVTQFFGYLGQAAALPIVAIKLLASYIGDFVDKLRGISSGNATKALNDLGSKLGPIGQLGALADKAWLSFYKHFGAIVSFLAPIADKIGNVFTNLGHEIVNGIGSLNFSDVLNVINTGLFAGLLLLVKKFVDKFRGGGGSLGEFVDTIKETFEGLTKTLETMQGTLKAATLLEIAAAVGILTISIMELSRIDQAGLIRSSAAITVMFTQLMGSLVIFDKFVEGEGFVKMPIMMGSLILLATAVDILASAVKKLAGLDWKGLERGLTGLGVILAELVASIRLMGNPEGLITTSLGLNVLAKAVKELTEAVTNLSGLSWSELTKGLLGVAGLLVSLGIFSKFAEADKVGVTQGAGIVLLAVGIRLLADAMKTMSGFSWTQIAKGLVGMAGGLVAMAGALKLVPPNSLLSSAAILVVATSLKLIGNAIGQMGSLSWGTIAKGLTSMAGALALIAAALYVLPPSTLLSAAAIFIVASSLGMITNALVKMGGQSWSAIAKGLVELAGALTIIGAAVIFMEGSLPGAAALLVVAAALAILTPVMKAFGSMSWESIAKSLLELAGVFVVIGAAGLLLAPLTPILLALGVAIGLIGIAMLAAGAGVFLFATGLTALSVAGAAGATALVAIVTAMLGLLPEVGKEIGLAVIAFATTIATAGPAILNAMTTVILALAEAIDKTAPKVVTTLLNLLLMLLQKLDQYVPKLIDAGAALIIALLNGIAKKIPSIAAAGTNLVIAFINAISASGVKIANAGLQAIINFINGVANAIRTHTAELIAAGKNLASAIISGLTGGLLGGQSAVGQAASALAHAALAAAHAALDSHSPSREFFKLGEGGGQGFANGLESMSDLVATTSGNVGKGAILAMSKTISGLSDQISANIDANPTITPVLDLSSVKKGAGQLNDLLSTTPLTTSASYSKAKVVSAGITDNQSAAAQSSTTTTTQQAAVSYTQNNYSPKALSAVEIYRQTNNQLSKVRGVLVYQDGGTEQSG